MRVATGQYPTRHSVTKLCSMSLALRRLHRVRRAPFLVPRLVSVRAIACFIALCSMALKADTAAAQAIVTNGYFTNVYVYQKSSPTETWEEHLVAANTREPGSRPSVTCPIPGLSKFDAFSRKCIDAFTRELMRPTWPSYFDPLAVFETGPDRKYIIHPPLFFGSGVALERCVDAAVHDAYNGVVQWDTVKTLANCHDSSKRA
jgi:hypothetical protein